MYTGIAMWLQSVHLRKFVSALGHTYDFENIICTFCCIMLSYEELRRRRRNSQWVIMLHQLIQEGTGF